MDETVPILGYGDERNLVQEFVAQYDAPAYVRRARRVEEALAALVARCRRQRDEWLEIVRMRLGRLDALAGEWEALAAFLDGDDQPAMLRQLYGALEPRLRHRLERTLNPSVLWRALTDLAASIERFNRRWERFLAGVDLAEVNALRDGYNRYYLLEKECAVRSPRVARQGYRRLEPLTTADLATLLPPLPVPRLKP